MDSSAEMTKLIIEKAAHIIASEIINRNQKELDEYGNMVSEQVKKDVVANSDRIVRDYKNYSIRDFVELVTEQVRDKTLFCTKEVLTSDEAARYMGISKSYLYKLTMRRQIPHYKPMGKVCYFNRQELEKWLQNNRVATDEELNQQAQSYCMNKQK